MRFFVFVFAAAIATIDAKPVPDDLVPDDFPRSTPPPGQYSWQDTEADSTAGQNLVAWADIPPQEGAAGQNLVAWTDIPPQEEFMDFDCGHIGGVCCLNHGGSVRLLSGCKNRRADIECVAPAYLDTCDGIMDQLINLGYDWRCYSDCDVPNLLEGQIRVDPNPSGN